MIERPAHGPVNASRPSPDPSRRVVLVTQGFETGGGVPSVVRWLHAGLRSNGYDVAIFDLASSRRDTASRRLTAPATWWRRSLSLPLKGSSVDRHWGANAVEFEPMRYRPRRELTRALGSFDLIQVVAGAPALANVAREAGIPVVLQAATRVRWERASQLAAADGPLRVWRSLMTTVVARIENRALRHVDGVLVWNAEMLNSLSPHFLGRAALAAPGVDTEVFAPRVTGWNHEGPLLSVCRLADRRKGLDRMIRAYARVVATRPDVPVLVLAGRGNLPDSDVALVEKLGLASRVHVRSDVTPPELLDLYRSASVFLQTSHEEGFGVSVLEAMACGLPVVTTETSGTKASVLNGRTGWLIAQDAETVLEEAFASKTLAVLDGDGMQMSRQAREHVVNSFSSKVSLKRFTDMYDMVLSSQAPAGQA